MTKESKETTKGPTKAYLDAQKVKDEKAHKHNADRLAARKKTAKASVVYVGPNMAGEIMLRHGQTFLGGVPDHLAEAGKADPMFAALFVPVADLAAARQKINKPGSFLHRAHNETLRKHLASRGTK